MQLTSLFHPAVAAWFVRSFAAPTAAQEEAWPAIKDGRDVLIAAPTGSGKTLAAFLAAIDGLVRQGIAGELADETQVVYVSPLKALSNDIRRNLERPLGGIREELAAQGLPDVAIRSWVRTGDTPQGERAQMRRLPPHILVTTPESLYILLGSESGRRMLASARSVIVDEIHAVAANKRGSHLALSLERLDAVCGRRLQRIGLSATQNPIEAVARFLVGADPVSPSPALREREGPVAQRREGEGGQRSRIHPLTPTLSPGGGKGEPACRIIDTGHRRQRDLALELPSSPLEAVMSGEVWEEVYDRLAELTRAHRTTLVFVNTRRMVERVTRQLSLRLGDERVAAHHGSLAKERRLDAEQRLKAGALQALVATASLELGIDIGEVDLVCQLGSPRSIAALLQRVGRSGHAVDGTPKGRLFPLSRDELVECAALVDSIARGELDRVAIPEQPLDVLAQQIVAEVAAEEWSEDALFALARRAWPFRDLPRAAFSEIVQMLGDGFSTRRGRRGALIHYDAVNRMLRGRRGARITALTSGGTIPDTADYQVVLEPENQVIGTVNEDFAVESLSGDVFQLGNAAYRIRRVERGTMRVEDAEGQPPNIPFWLGEAPGRSDELSQAVSRLRAEVEARLDTHPHPNPPPLAGEGTANGAAGLPPPPAGEGWGGGTGVGGVFASLAELPGVGEAAARQIAEYLAAGHAALGVLPTRETIVFERFFDAVGGMQLVVHSPYGSRLNRAWGLALRKRFCTKFNFELQAAATEDNIVLSLTTAHSFDLAEAAHYLHPASVRDLLVQALLDAPMFMTRWRWVAGVALALPRFRGGKKVPPPLARMDAEDLITAIFPDQLACAENLVGAREIPDHPLVRQTIGDCLTQVMDIAGLERLLAQIHSGTVRIVARDLTEPSPLALEVLSARPYAYLDDAPLEERRTQAVMGRRWLAPEEATDLGRLDAQAIARVQEEAWPEATNRDELHDALAWLGFLTPDEVAARPGWAEFLGELAWERRATLFAIPASSTVVPAKAGTHGDASVSLEVGPGFRRDDKFKLWVAAERLPQFAALWPEAPLDPPIVAPATHQRDWLPEEALVEIVRGRLEGLGPVGEAALAAPLGLAPADIAPALAALQAEGFALRGRFTPGAAGEEWCERRLLARIHRYTLRRLRAEIEPVAARDFLRFLFDWQRVTEKTRMEGPDALAAVLGQLEGFEAPASAWETEILPARVSEYDPSWLDDHCLAGRIAWARLRPRNLRPDAAERGASSGGPVRSTPITLLARRHGPLWASLSPMPDHAQASARAQAVLGFIRDNGASFFDELVDGTRLLRPQAEEAVAELVGLGLINSDSFAGLRALLMPAERRKPRRRRAVFGMEDSGRWALARRPRPGSGDAQDPGEAVEHLAHTLLRRYGVVFWRLLEREAAWLPPWRDLLRIYRRLEARGDIRGGRFVAGFAGEQFALPEAIGLLREVRRRPHSGEFLSLSGADPLNLLGILTPGARLAALAVNRVLYRDGIPVAVLAGGEVQFLEELDAASRWQAEKGLRRGAVPAALIALA
ncbi:MAG TPA: DEAD/DEAH box helicase [Stellaceae bacterium]|nr:DEAD/DEAH box helicase [Stellaceae bacterium]